VHHSKNRRGACWLSSISLGFIHNQYPKIYFGLNGLFSAGGAASATRHLYLQSLPADQVPTCGPDLAFLIDKAYFADALRHDVYWRWQLR